MRESGSALPPKPVADQSPYVKRHFLWAPLGRPVCVIKIDLSPLLFFRKSARVGVGERERVTAGKSEIRGVQRVEARSTVLYRERREKGKTEGDREKGSERETGGEREKARERGRGTARAAHRL